MVPFQRSRVGEEMRAERMLSVRNVSGMTAQTLGVPDTSKSYFLRVNEVSLDFAIKQAEFLKQHGMTMRRKRLNQVLDHRAQPSDNLQIIRSAGSYFAKGQMDEIFPVGCPEDHAELAGVVQYSVGAQMTAANHAQHAVQLIDRENGRGRIIDRRR